MNEQLARIGGRLKPGATVAGYVLAIYGFLTLGLLPLRWLNAKLTLSDAGGIARSICERYLVPDSGFDDNHLRLAGVQLVTMKRLDGVRFQFRGLKAVLDWRIHSDGLSRLETQRILAQLPTGSVSTVVTSELPPLPDSSSTTLQAVAVFESEDGCQERKWVTVTASNGKVYHSLPDRFLIWWAPVTAVQLLGVAAVIGAVLYLLGRRARRP